MANEKQKVGIVVLAKQTVARVVVIKAKVIKPILLP